MPTIAELYRALTEHENLTKSAATKKQAIANPAGGGAGANTSEAIDNVLGPNIAETKVRIKKKLEEAAGVQKAQEGLSANREDEAPGVGQAPVGGDKMPPGGDVAGKAAAAPAAAAKQAELPAALKAYAEKKAKGDKKDEPKGEEKDASVEKIADEYIAAGRLIAQGFHDELTRLMGESR